MTKGEESLFSNKGVSGTHSKLAFPPSLQVTIEILPSKEGAGVGQWCFILIYALLQGLRHLGHPISFVPCVPPFCSLSLSLSLSLVRLLYLALPCQWILYMSRVKLSLTYSVLLDPLKLDTTQRVV